MQEPTRLKPPSDGDHLRGGWPPAGAILNWLRDRYDLSGLEELIRHKEVPVHRHSIWYYFGGITLFFFLIQVVTGLLLLLYYQPTAESAFESVQFIVTEVRFGWLIRSIHSWSANLMIGAVFAHMFTTFFLKSYRRPRELTWVSGVLLLFLCLSFGFSGYLLPWNELAFFATKVGTEIVGVVPLAGEFLVRFLRGGANVTGATLTRFYAFHVAILPMITIFLLLLHLLAIQKQGMSVPLKLEQSGTQLKKMRFFPHFLLRDLLAWVLALGVLVATAALFPWELGIKADPFSPAPAGIRPEWYFVFMFQTLKFIPATVLLIEGELLGILAFGLAAVLLVMVPFLDRKAARGENSKLLTIIGLVSLLYFIVMTVVAYVVPQTF